MRFEWPLALAGLILLLPAAAAAYVLVERRRARFAVRFTNLEVLASVAPPAEAWGRRFVPPALFFLALALSLAALARPHIAHAVERPQSTIVLVVDTSGSMVAADVRPTRLAAAQAAVRRFVQKLPERFLVGIVVFSSEPRVTLPITEEHDVAIQGVGHMTAFGGTAIGDAIARAVELIRSSTAGASDPGTPPFGGPGRMPSAIVLLSDGAQNQGHLQPLQGAARAKALKIPVHTVALGTAAGVIRISHGSFRDIVSVPPDPRTLKEIAAETGGGFFTAASAARLTEVYAGLASRLSTRKEYREATSVFLAAAACLLVVAGLLSALWGPRLP